MVSEQLHTAPFDFAHRLSPETDESEDDTTSNSSSPCKPVKNSLLFRRPLIVSSEERADYYNDCGLDFSTKNPPERQSSRSLFDAYREHPLLRLHQPSVVSDNLYSPIQSPTESVNSFSSLASIGTFASAASELDSEVETEEESADKDEDAVLADDLKHNLSLEKDSLLGDTPVARHRAGIYPSYHRVNRSVLGISLTQHRNKAASGLVTEPEPSTEDSASPLSGSRTRIAHTMRRSLWMPPAKVRRTQSMFATPEQMLREQQRGIADRTPACESSTHGISFLESPECPIPTFNVKQDPFPRITHDTLCRLIDGEYGHIFSEVLVIDCRFEYEYEGGHIEGAINVNSKQQLEQVLFNENACRSLPGRRLLVFHCEYSAYRSPLLAGHLRHCDRNYNANRYPNLCYPDVLVLDGGYRKFYDEAAHRCVPRNYVGMDHQEHQKTCQREMSKFRLGMKARKFQTFGSTSSLQLDNFKFPAPKTAFQTESSSTATLPKLDISNRSKSPPASPCSKNIFGI